MTSYLPGNCCFTGSLHEGTPIGTIQEVGGISTYVSTPSDAISESKSLKLLLFCADGCGIHFQSNQLLADQFAVNGYHVYMPDLLGDDANPFGSGRDLYKWLEDHLPAKVDPIFTKVLDALFERFADQAGESGSLSLSIVSYCFGAKYAVRILAGLVGPTKRNAFRIKPAFLAHPSFVDRTELEAIQKGVSIAAAETDDIFTAEKRRESEDILRKLGLPYEIRLFSGVDHGFANKGALDDRRKQWAKEQAFLQALNWLEEWDE